VSTRVQYTHTEEGLQKWDKEEEDVDADDIEVVE
jgi:hypothetical protein